MNIRFNLFRPHLANQSVTPLGSIYLLQLFILSSFMEHALAKESVCDEDSSILDMLLVILPILAAIPISAAMGKYCAARPPAIHPHIDPGEIELGATDFPDNMGFPVEEFNQFKDRCKILSTPNKNELEVLKSRLDHFSNKYACPVTLDIMHIPVTLPSGFTFEYQSIVDWIKAGQTHKCLGGSNRNLNIRNTKDLYPNVIILNDMKAEYDDIKKMADRLSIKCSKHHEVKDAFTSEQRPRCSKM